MENGGEVCFAVIGGAGRDAKGYARVCLVANCSLKSHRTTKKRFVPEGDEMFAVPAKGSKDPSTKKEGAAAYTEPMIATGRVVPSLLRDFEGVGTSLDWGKQIGSALKAWKLANAKGGAGEARGVYDIPIVAPGPEFDEFEPLGSFWPVDEDDLPTREFRAPEFVELDDTTGSLAQAVLETQEAVEAVNANLQEVAEGVEDMGRRVADHFQPVVMETFANLNLAAKAIALLAESVGEVEHLQEEHGVDDVVSGILEALAAVTSTDEDGAVVDKVSELETAVGELDQDVNSRITASVLAAAQGLALKLEAIVRRLARVEQDVAGALGADGGSMNQAVGGAGVPAGQAQCAGGVGAAGGVPGSAAFGGNAGVGGAGGAMGVSVGAGGAPWHGGAGGAAIGGGGIPAGHVQGAGGAGGAGGFPGSAALGGNAGGGGTGGAGGAGAGTGGMAWGLGAGGVAPAQAGGGPSGGTGGPAAMWGASPPHPGGGGGGLSGGTLAVSAVVLSDSGVPMCTLGQLIQQVTNLTDEVTRLRADVTAQGGVVFERWSFPSEQSLRELIVNELPSGNAIAAFPDPVSLLAHDKDAANWSEDKKLRDELAELKDAGMDRATDRRFVSTFRRRAVAAYHSGDRISAKTKLSSLATLATWKGDAGADGKALDIMALLKSSKESCGTYIEDYLPPGQLRDMAQEMRSASFEFHEALHTHIREEIDKLIQLGIPEDEAMLLISEEFYLMFSDFFECRKGLLEFEPSMNLANYLARVVWLSLKCHMSAKALLKNGLKYSAVISAAFVRFLTKQTGANTSAGLKSKLTELAKTVKTEVAGIKKAAETEKGRLTRLLDRNPTLKKP